MAQESHMTTSPCTKVGTWKQTLQLNVIWFENWIIILISSKAHFAILIFESESETGSERLPCHLGFWQEVQLACKCERFQGPRQQPWALATCEKYHDLK